MNRPVPPLTALRRRLVLCVALVAALVVARPPASDAQSRTDYRIGPRDLLAIQVFGDASISGNYRVEADGGFAFPLIGRVLAGGRTILEIESAIKKQLGEGFYNDPQVSVTIQEFGSQKLFVMGEVKTPGGYTLSGDTTVLAALALAGGTLPSAGDTLIVLRPRSGASDASAPAAPDASDSQVLVRVSLTELQTGTGGALQNVHLQHGDTIYVPKVEMVFVTGQVRNSGSFPYQKGLTVLQAIALAGGLNERGAQTRVRITRTVDGAVTELRVKPTDLVQPGDTIVVLERYF